jgi:hypothetical protein
MPARRHPGKRREHLPGIRLPCAYSAACHRVQDRMTLAMLALRAAPCGHPDDVDSGAGNGLTLGDSPLT